MIRRLQYNHWANGQFIALLAQHKPEHKGHTLMNHILAAQRIWIARIAYNDLATEVWPSSIQEDEQNKLNDQFLDDCITLCKDKPISEIIHYKNTKGTAFKSTIEEILDHVLNHGTYHRGQIAIILKEQGIEPPVTDMIYYFRVISQPT